MAEKIHTVSRGSDDRTILEPDQVAIVYDEKNGYQVFLPLYEEDAEMPEPAAVLVAVAIRLTDDKEFYEGMLKWFEDEHG